MLFHDIIATPNGNFICVRTAERYRERGWVPIPLLYRSNKPLPKKWEQISLDGFDLNEQFPVGGRLNVGISLGEPSGGLVDAAWTTTRPGAPFPSFCRRPG
jgi:hypothetical protein